MQNKLLRFKICSIPICFLGVLFLNNRCSAIVSSAPAIDRGTITPINIDSSPTASISLSKTNLASDATAPGNTATTSTNVTVNVSDATSYSLILSFDKTNITSGSTTLTAGNAVTNNTWGYAWDGASTYSAPTTSGSTLSVPTLSNNAVSFTKTLTLAAKFASNAEAGHYTANGTLSLTASPKQVMITLADITQMQQLAEGYAPDACKDTTIPSGQEYAGPYTLTDVRDNNTYTVYKFKDSKCWMMQNLRLRNGVPDSNGLWAGRTLKNTTSDISTAEWTLPSSDISGFSSASASNMYYNPDNATGYYSWCAATAGTCSSVSYQQDAPSSICPKGWKLPSKNDFSVFASTVGAVNNSVGSNLIRNSPYNFAYTGTVEKGKLNGETSYGCWWQREAGSGGYTYYFYVSSSTVAATDSAGPTYAGVAIRCVAQ